MIKTFFVPFPPGLPEVAMDGVLDHQVGKPMTAGILVSYRILYADRLLEMTVDVGPDINPGVDEP